MPRPQQPRTIAEEDVEARTIRRRTFLGRFGAAAGAAGLLGFAMGCETTDSCDADEEDPPMSDSDNTDPLQVDQDFADPCDSDGV